MPFFGVPIRNGLPIGLGSVAGFGVQQFDPSQLFAGGTVAGAWYDPSDLSTMFTTSAGTTPVAMPGLGSAVPVGLMLDKSQNGVGTNGAKRVNLLTYSEQFDNGAWTKFNTTISATKVTDPLGGNTAQQLFEQAITSGHSVHQFSTVSSGVLHRASASIKANGRNFAFLRTSDSAGTTDIHGVSVDLVNGVATNAVGTTTNITCVAEANGFWRVGFNFVSTNTARLEIITSTDGVYANRSYAGDITKGVIIWGADLRLASEANTQPTYQRITDTWYSTLPGNHAIAFNNTTARPELRARVNLLVATATLSTQSVTTQATSYTLSFAGAGSITLSGTATGSYNAGTHTITCTAGTLTLTVSGTVTTADLRPANSGALLPAYQAVVDANTYDTSGFPLYLRFDGIDDSMYTPANLNLSGTDKVAVFAGVRKLSDAAAAGIIVEFSAAVGSNNGAFLISNFDSSGIVGPRYGFWSKGTGSAFPAADGYAAPITNVVSGVGDISGDQAILRVDGAQVALSTADQGTGNYGTYPLYIGSRNNSSLWFNGHLYSLAVVGSAVSGGNIAAMESWVAGRTGIQI